MSKFYLTQSALKDLEADNTCPFRWKTQWVDKEIKMQTTEAMDKGSYFEYGVLGSGAIPGAEVTDLPRLKSGEKSAEHKRIDAQIERVRGMLFEPTHPEYLGLEVIMKQVEIKTGERKGTCDIVCVDKDGNEWIIDLKLTKDVNNDFGPYGYGNNWEDLDLVQLIYYQDIYYQNKKIKPKVALLVVDYSPQKNIVFGEIVVSEHKRIINLKRFEEAENAIKLYNERGWVKIPHPVECGACPLKCEARAQQTVIKKVINY